MLLANGPREAESLVAMGARRELVRVVLEAVDVAAAEAGEATMLGEVISVDDDSAASVTTVLTAMATGRAVVVPEIGALPDLVADEVTGIVVPPGRDPSAAIRSLRVDAVRRESMGLAALDRVAACLSTTVVLPALDRVLTEVSRVDAPTLATH